MIFALGCILVWIPLDTDTGLIETVRRRVEIGDAMAPTLAALFVLVGGAILCIAPGEPARGAGAKRPLLFCAAAMIGVLAAGVVLMLCAGPLALWLADAGRAEPREYRLMRDSFPWKYIGFVLGGTVAISGLIALAERRMTWAALIIGLVGVLGMVALFDLPFDDLLLPPNGDY
ncbi:hypothetical protein [uncultured Tateyamaria sp.]|uniref:hypothetical protein n=1 Tax=uncultured Tateyamaria sp. TaxID=455651 RepID=UPI00261D143C|nr:hypothetical protein [uncultured Tateyamaria sp.]